MEMKERPTREWHKESRPRQQKLSKSLRPSSSCRPKPETANKLLFERPMRSSRPRSQTQVVLLLPRPVWAGCVVSDSLVDDRGCLTDRPE